MEKVFLIPSKFSLYSKNVHSTWKRYVVVEKGIEYLKKICSFIRYSTIEESLRHPKKVYSACSC